MSDTNFVAKIKRSFNHWFNQLLNTRKHRGKTIKLSHKNIYVLPSRFGMAFILFTILIFLLGSNYQNNLIILSAYSMLSFMIVNFFLAYLNLLGLQINLLKTTPGYQHNGFTVDLMFKRSKPATYISLSNHLGSAFIKQTDNGARIMLAQHQTVRGKHHIDRLKLLSRFPFGLVSAWSYLIFPAKEYIYPTPVPFSIHHINQSDENTDDDGEHASLTQGDDFQSLRPYVVGDNMSRIAWKQYAKKNILYTKSFLSPLANHYHFNLNSVPGEFELKLQHLCYLLNHAESDKLSYSLTLPNKHIPLGSGESHLQQCLEAISDV